MMKSLLIRLCLILRILTARMNRGLVQNVILVSFMKCKCSLVGSWLCSCHSMNSALEFCSSEYS